MIQVFEKLSAVEFLNFSVGELAERFGCSRRHLNRLFHHYFGVSVAALRMEMRLLKAVSLLRNPEAKIIHVAEACGFNQQGLFNICFKRRFGASPGQWRRLNLQAESLPAHLDTDAVACPLRSNGLCPWSRNSCVDDNAAPASVSPAPKQGPARFLIQTNGSSAKASRQHDNGQTRIPAGNQGRDDLRVRP